MKMKGTAALGSLVCAVLLVAGGCGTQHPTSAKSPPSSRPVVSNPLYAASASLTGPITTGHVIVPLSANPLDLAANGYVEQEYFASGTAHAFTATSAPSDGRWTIKASTSASFRTRILVRRPSDPARFNGTVVVEWMNVSAGESAPDWDFLNPELMRDGYAWVGVSAQALGVDGGNPLLGGTASKGLVTEEPAALRDASPPRRSIRPRYVRSNRQCDQNHCGADPRWGASPARRRRW